MSIVDAVARAGPAPTDIGQSEKRRYSELLSRYLAEEVADGLRSVGFKTAKPIRGGPSDKEFQGGLGPKRVDVSVSDERHGLLLAVSVKTISFPPYAKNLPNRFGDLCAEAITLHMRFPYAIVCALFAFHFAADEDATPRRRASTFQRAVKLFSTISGRTEYTDPPEKFENVSILLYSPSEDSLIRPQIRLANADTGDEFTEEEYFAMLRSIYLQRNPHAQIESLEQFEL